MACSTWGLSICQNIDVIIDCRHTDNLSDERRTELMDALFAAGATSIEHYSNIIPTFNETTPEAAIEIVSGVLTTLFITTNNNKRNASEDK